MHSVNESVVIDGVQCRLVWACVDSARVDCGGASEFVSDGIFCGLQDNSEIVVRPGDQSGQFVFSAQGGSWSGTYKYQAADSAAGVTSFDPDKQATVNWTATATEAGADDQLSFQGTITC